MTNNEIVVRALANTGITALNEMQQAVLDAGTTKDMVLLSPTGSGKTLAFLLPLLTTLTDEDKKIQAVIIAPSRELALQIETVLRSLGAGYKVNCCYGGHPIRTEKKSLEHPPTVLIGTPGRIVDHLERGNINLDSVRTLILDEFDKSLELGFLAEMKEILAHLPGVRRRVLTSATAAVDIPAFTGITAPVRLSFLKDVKESKGLVLRVVKSPVKDKLETLYKLLGELKGGSALIFCNYRETVERVSNYLTEMGVDNEYFHGGMEQPERERALSHFRNGSATVFISTDLASRGLDIPEVKNVIHYHLPVSEEAYVHRNGRTARWDATGTSYLILHAEEKLPEYIPEDIETMELLENPSRPPKSVWTTIYIGKGKKEKLSRMDIAGFLYKKGNLTREDVGAIDVKEHYAFVAVRRAKVKQLLNLIQGEKIKGMKTIIEEAK